jgi:Mg-chelatase subunit ChlD
MQPRSYWLALLSLVLPLTAHAHLDVVFALDTTGSMGGELSEVKNRVKQIAEALKPAGGQQRVRFGVVAFRDRGDAYVTQVSALTEDVERTFAFLAGLSAGGGGDGPEDVISAIDASLSQIHWDTADTTERQIFLIGDAPPHLDYQGAPAPAELVRRAREARIVINAIGCRSLPGEGVAFFRELAYQTEGSYQHIGRVDVKQGAVAQAVLKTLTPRAEAERFTVPLSEAVPVGAPTPATAGPGVLAVPTPGQSGQVCQVAVTLPRGVRLAAPPRVAASSEALMVALKLEASATPSEAGEQRYQLPACAPSSVPLRVSIGG